MHLGEILWFVDEFVWTLADFAEFYETGQVSLCHAPCRGSFLSKNGPGYWKDVKNVNIYIYIYIYNKNMK